MEDCTEKKKGFVLCGTFVHSTEDDPMVVLENHSLGVVGGKIAFFEAADQLDECLRKFHLDRGSVRQLQKRQFVMPGMVDTHIHAPQYLNAGKGLDLGLLDWLKKYTFPTEAKFKDLKFAEIAYRKAVRRVLRNGTTTASYFATIHTDATILLCDIIDEFGQRAHVGKVNVNQHSPDYYTEDTAESITETKRFVEAVLAKKYKHITPCITPRFSVTCTRQLLDGLGDLAKSYNLPIQTHICETEEEVLFEREIHHDADHYTHTYDRSNLLTDKTVLAHGIYLTQNELDIIKDRGSSISHCPNSNLSIRSGLLDVRKLINQEIKVGLGTDVSGGYHPSILDAIRTAVHVSNAQAILNSKSYQPINVREAFRLATLGGSKAMALDDQIGNFVCGKEFDALVIDPEVPNSPMCLFEGDSITDIVEKFLYLGDDRNITAIYVSGNNVLRD